MSAVSLLTRLRELGITIQLVNDKLKISGAESKLTPALIDELKNKKAELIAFLQENAAKRLKYESIDIAETKEYYELSSAQKRIFILQQMNQDSTAYNMPEIIPLPAGFDLGKIDETFKKLIKRHESLRTSFAMVIDTPVQVVHDEVEIETTDYTDYIEEKNYKIQNTNYKQIPNHKLQITNQEVPFGQILNASGENTSLTPTRDTNTIIKEFVRPFDLSEAPLLRVGLLKTGKGGHLLLVDMHHIISDGVSHEILVKDFLALHEGEVLLPLRVQYKDFSQWKNGEKEKENLKRQEEFWMKEFAGEIPVLELPTDYPRPVEQSFEGDSLNFEISAEDTRGLNTMAVTGGSTLFMVLVVVVNILLSKLSGKEEIIIGTPIAGRRHTDLEKIIGMFVNTLSLRNYPVGDRTFGEFLTDVKERMLLVFENQEYPFEELVDKLSVKRNLGRNPLFDFMFVLYNMNTDSGGQEKETELEISRSVQTDFPKEYEDISQTAKFDLTLIAMEIGRGLSLSFQYCTKLFKKETVERFIIYFKKIVSIAANEPGIKLSEIEVLSEEEMKRILNDFNKTESEYPKDKTIHQLFEEQVERTPGNIALTGPKLQNTKYKLQTNSKLQSSNNKQSGALRADFDAFGEIQLSYGLLNERSNRLACTLLEKGVRLDTIVGIKVERSIEMVIGILGILKSGGAYLPIDPGYPQKRIDYMLKDSGANILLTDSGLSQIFEKLSIVDCRLLMVNETPPDRRRLNNPPKEANSINNYQLIINNLQLKQTSLAYVIYTSGTTGRPKGSLIEHRNVVRLLFNDKFQFDFSDRDVWTLFHSFCFDFSVWEMYGALLYGGKLIIVPKMIARDTVEFLGLLNREAVTVLNQTPPAFYNLMNEVLLPHQQANSLFIKYVIFGGEALNPLKLKDWLKKYPQVRLINMFGITETTVHVTYKALNEKYIELNISNIGKPIPTLSTYILDKYLKPVPVMVAGEICVGGDGVGRGYLNQVELTEGKFIQNPHLLGDRLYRSGDMGRFLENGDMEYSGRLDKQVKIRGFRIELGEIENQLLKYEGIKNAVVLAGETSDEKYLCAYIVTDKEFTLTELRTHLSGKVPDYMIPSYFVRLDKIPLTPNGKVDRKALPKPELNVGESYTAPGNEIEKKLVELWSEVLCRDSSHMSQLQTSIGIDDNFFELGGHSLKATILVSRIHKELNVKLPLAEFFKTPTIRKLSKSIKGLTKNKYICIKLTEEKEYYEMSSAQKRLYAFHQMDEKCTRFNMPSAIRLEGPIIKEKVEYAFKKLIKRHENFRTSFKMNESVPTQVIHDAVGFKVEYYELCTEHEEESVKQIVKKFFRYFDLSQPPLLRVGMIRMAEEKHILLIDTHHIISDGQSVGITRNEFLVLYAGEELPGFKLQYKDFSEWQRRLFESGKMKKQEVYWLNRFKGEIPVLNMPMDYDWPSVYRGYGDRVSFKVNYETTANLKRLVLETEITLYIMLLAVYNILLSKYSRQEDIIVGSPIAGRRHVDLENMVGLFVNMLALRNRPGRDKSFIEFLTEVKTDTLEAFENQDYQFENLIWKLGIKAEYNRNPLFSAVFVLQNTVTLGIEVPNKYELTKIKASPYEMELERVHHEILLSVVEGNDELLMELQYATELFKESTIRKISQHYVEILKQVIENRYVKLEDIKLSHDLFTADTTVIKENEISFGF